MKKSIPEFLSTVFLVLSLLFAVGISLHTFIVKDAKADEKLEVCDTWNGVDDCQGPPTNCYCEVVVDG